MFQRVRKHLTPSTFIAFIALVFALTGGAFAASGHGGGSGSKATASAAPLAGAAKAKAKTKAGPRGPAGPKGATGATGSAGATGPAGPTGPGGAQGPQGPAGNNGANGESVTVAAASGTECTTGGGAKVSNGSGSVPVCNGKAGAKGAEGSPWTAGGTLPVKSTETGTFVMPVPGEVAEGVRELPISFPIELANSLDKEHYEIVTAVEHKHIHSGGTGTACNGSPAEPTAPSGFLCVYMGHEEENMPRTSTIASYAVIKPEGAGEPGVSQSGGALVLTFLPEAADRTSGTWAVTG